MPASMPPSRFRAKFKAFLRKYPDFGIQSTQHSRQRMRKWKIHLPQIRSILRSGAVSQVELDIRTGLDKYRVVGRDPDGRMLEVVVNLIESERGRIDVITVIDTTGLGGGSRPRKRRGG